MPPDGALAYISPDYNRSRATIAMTLLYQHSAFLDHDTGLHPENARRLTPLLEPGGWDSLDATCQQPESWQLATDEQLQMVHGAGHLRTISETAAAGGGQLDVDTVLSARSGDVARLAAGAACDAVDQVLAGNDTRALCVVRPPGHHALPNRAMGFCLYNSIAVAARWAVREHDLSRVLVVDWDVHHGNGTQDIFWEDQRVAFFSAHRSPFYPGTGDADETGGGPGLGWTRNLPVAFGIPRREFLERFTTELTDFARRAEPELILISAGFDAHRADPVGSLGLEIEDFACLSELVGQIAEHYCGGKIVSVLEGGYNPAALRESLMAHLAVLNGLSDRDSQIGP